MQEGGVVNPGPLASDSLSQQTSSASPLLPTEGSTDSGTPEGTFNFNLLSEDFRAAIGLDIPTLDIPPAFMDFQYRDEEGNLDADRTFQEYLLQNRTIQPPVFDENFDGQISEDGTIMFNNQEDLDSYRAYVESMRKEQDEILQDFNSQVESYSSDVDNFNLNRQSYLEKMGRLATAESLSEALKFRNSQTGEYDLSKLQLNEQKDVQYKVPGVGITNRANIKADDLLDYSNYFVPSKTESLLTALETGAPTHRNVVSGDGSIVQAPLGSSAILTEEGERWMATSIDPEALELLRNKQYAPERVARANDLKKRIDSLSKADDLSTGQKMALRDMRVAFEDVKTALSEDLEFTEEEFNDARKSVWARLNREKALENIVLDFDEWKNLSSQGLQDVISGQTEDQLRDSYQDYKGDMEVAIYQDLLTDPSAMLAASYFGDDGFRLFLDDRDAALGERNTRFQDARLSSRAGIIDLKGSIDAFMTDASKFETVGTGSIKGGTALRRRVSEEKADQIEQEYFAREAERRLEIQNILDKQTKYATAARFIDTFGQAALVNDQTQIEDFLQIKSQTRKDIEFVDFVLPAIQSLPQSAAAQVAGAAAGLATANPYVGAGVTMGIMQGLVTSKTYYNSYLDPRFDDLSESQRRMYAIAFGAAESAGEGLDYLTMRAGGKLISGGVTGRAIQDAFGRGVYNRFTYLGGRQYETRSALGFAKDLFLGTAGAMGLNVGGEYIAEGGTGLLQYIFERKALGEPIDWAEAMDIAHHDGRIGMYAGLFSGGAITSLQLSVAGIESTLFEERFNAKAQMLALAQYIRSGAMDGVENQQDHEQLRRDQQKLADQKAGRITMSPQEIQDTRDNIGRLTDKAARENQRLANQFEKLRQEGRFDVIAEMIAMDNREMFLDWALSFDKRQIVVDASGRARTKDGRFAGGYGSRMDSQLQGITEQQKKKFREELNELRALKKVRRVMVDLGMVVGTPISSGRASLVAQTESPEQGYILLADEEGNMVLNIDEATLEALPQEQQELLKEAAEYAVNAKGQARIVVHTNKRSLQIATGVKNAAYLEASEEQRRNGMQDEVHVLLEDGGEVRYRTDLVHEAGHFRFRDSVNDDAARKKMVEELTQLANQKPGSFLNELYNAVQDAYKGKSVEDQEKELINHFVQAVAQGATVVKNSVLKADLSELTGGLERWGMADLFGKKKVSSLDAVIMAQQFAQEVSKTTELYGAFTRQDFENLAEHQKQQQELEQKQYSPQEEGEVDDSIAAMESRTLGGSTFLQNATIQYSQVFDDLSPGGRGKQRQRFKEITVKDYNHFRNFYIKMTGNGSVPSNMMAMKYEKDGKVYNLRPPRLRTDRQGNIIQMQAPKIEGYNARVVRTRVESAQFEKEGLEALGAKNDLLREEFSKSVVVGMTNPDSFFPLELLQRKNETGIPLHRGLSAQERLAATDHAIANIQALNRSDITREQVKERGRWLSIEDNQDIFNMAGGEYQTREQKIDLLQEGAEGLGLFAYEMFPAGSNVREDRHRHFGLATNEELDSALSFLKNARSGVKLETPLRDISKPLENKIIGSKNAVRTIPDSELKNIGLEYVSESVYDALVTQYGIDFMRTVVITAHNLDRTRVGPVKAKMTLPEGGQSSFSSANNKDSGLVGGPAGPAHLAEKGVALLHSNTNAASSQEIVKNAEIAAQQGYLGYALLFRVLSEKNSFNNPKVMSILIDMLIQYSEQSDAGRARVAEVIESFMENTYASEEIDISVFIPSEMRDDSQQGVESYKYTQSVFDRYKMYILKGVLDSEGLSVQDGKLKVSEEGVINLLNLLKGASEKIGFGDRGAFVSKILQSKGGVSAKGNFVSEQQFLDAINDPKFKNAESGDVVAVSFADISTDENGLLRTQPVEDITKNISGVDKGRVAYKFGVMGSAGFKLVKKFMPPTPELPFEPRAKMTTKGTLQQTGVDAKSLESRRLGGRVYVEGGDSWTASTATPYGAALQRAALRFQDKFSDVMLLQQDIEVFRGSKVPQSQDFEMAMDTYYGIVRNDLENIEGFLNDINTKRKSFGITSDQLSDYLYARHAIERNKFISDRTEGANESGSGMTNERAEEILNELESAEMRILANDVYKIIEYTRNFMVDGGLETRSIVEEWRNRFENYVPLNGLAVDEMDEATTHYPTGGAGMAIYGPSVRKAVGRESKTGANIIGNVVMQAMATAQRARKDQAMLKLYRLIDNNPNSDVWSVHGPKNPIMSMGKRLSDQQAKARQDVVPIRINGKQHFIKFKDVSHAQALNGMTVEKLDATSRAMAKYTGFLRNSYTVYNPAFFISNFARDFQSAIYNAAAEIEREGGILEGYGLSVKDFNKALAKTTFTSLGMLLKSAHGGDMSAEMQAYMEEWEASGGRTGWSYSDTLNKLVTELGDKTVDKSKTGEAVARAWGSTGGAMLGYVESINEAFENSIRLAAYIEARKAGMTKERSAQLSKNITVNFNKSGNLTPSINSYFLFFNAAVQGMSRFNRSFGNLKSEVDEKGDKRGAIGRLPASVKMGVGIIMFEYAKTIINVLMSAVDDDDELYYTKIADYRKQRGSIFMLGPRDPLVVPLPYGMNLFNNIGTMLGEMTMGVRSPESAAAFFALSAHASFSPISFGQGDNLLATAVSTALPSALKPAAEVAFNSTYFGGKVFQEQYPFGTETPEYTLAFRSPDFVVDMAQYLNEMSGGREKISGDMNFNPDPYYYLLISLTGGAGKFASDVVDLGYTGSQVVKNAINETTDSKGFLQALIDTEKPRIRRSDIPIVKILYGEASRFFDYDLFIENRQDVEQFVAQAKAYQEGEDVTVEGLNFVGINQLRKDLKSTEEMLDAIRSFKKQLRDSDEIDYIKRMNMLYDLGEEERKAIMYFNARYYDLRGQYVDPKPQGLIPTETVKQALGIYEQ